MANANELNDNDFFYAYMAEYLDEALSGDKKRRYEQIVKSKPSAEAEFEQFTNARGNLQVDLEQFQVDERQLHELHNLVETDAARVAHENKDIEVVGSKVFLHNTFRRLVVLGIMGALGWGIYSYLKPPAPQVFDPIEALVYEALAMEENPAGRIDLPTASEEEVHDYINNYPDLGFKLPQLSKLPESWQLDGGSVIDYDVAKIAVLMYTNPVSKENAFVFAYKGKLSDLPKAEPGNHQGLVYQTYASSKVNVVTWQMSDQLVGMIVGHRAAPDLAALASMVSASH
ncbi:MAG: hypothetical protein AB7T49_09615 [Oligoflexales bacterium]